MSRPSDRQRRKAKKLRQERKRYTTAIRARRNELHVAERIDCRGWAIIKAYAPDPDCFRATGHGTAGIIRQRPDGRLISSFFHLNLSDGGLCGAFGKDETDLAEALDLMQTLQSEVPPWVESTPDLCSRYVWGAYAWGLDEGFEWEGEIRSRYLALVPPLSGRAEWWLQQLSAGEDPLVTPALVQVIRNNPPPDDLPEGKEIMIWTTATFSLADHDAAVHALEEREPEFIATDENDGEVTFDWTREYPKNHWSPLATLGGRQILGSVRVGPYTLLADAKTLSMAAVLISKLKSALGPSIRLTATTWKSAEDLLREARERGGDDLTADGGSKSL